MRAILTFFIAMVSMVSSPLSSSITEVHSMDEVRVFIDGLPADTLAIFDIDYVLLVSSEPAFQFPNMKQHKDIFKRIYGQLSPDEQDAFLNLIVRNHPPLLLDNQSPQLIRDLTTKGLRPIALTSLWGSMDVYRYEGLKALGIDFSGSFPCKDCFFHTLPQVRGRHPSYFKGILFGNGVSVDKGHVLLSFFEISGWKPSRIVFVDDTRRNLENVEKALHPHRIECFCLEFHGAKQYVTSTLDATTFEQKCNDLAEDARKELARDPVPLL